MRSKRLSLPAHQPSIFSQQSFNQPRLHATQSYEIQEQLQMMISANQIIQQICYKTPPEINELLSINVTIVQQIMKNKLIRGLKGEKMMMLAICELVILIKQNTLTLKRPERQFELRNYRYEEHGEKGGEGNINIEDVLEELESIRKSVNSHEKLRVESVNRAIDRVEGKLSRMFGKQGKLDVIMVENQKLLSQERAIRELLEQEIEDYEKENKVLRERSDARTNEENNELEKLREEIMVRRAREGELITELREREDSYADEILNSDILPMLLLQGISLEQVLENR